MLYKPDWYRAQERLEAWWNGEVVDRAVIQVTASRSGYADGPEWSIWSPESFLDDPQSVVDGFESYCEGCYFGGEAYPNLWINLGPGIVAAYLGAVPRFGDVTTWFETPREREEIEEIPFNPANEWWQKTCELTSVAVKRGRGRFVTGVTDIGGTLDAVASLRGTQRLCFDLVDSPSVVTRLASRINAVWFECYAGLFDIIRAEQEGTSAWMGVWSPGRWYPLQCDFSAMLSPHMFERFVLPDLEEQCRWLDHSIYHWDGPGQLPHLDMLLEIEELDGIQWVPGAGAEAAGSPRWIPYYERILAKGKNLVLEVQPEDVEPLIRELGPRGVLLQTRCDSEEEARCLLDRATRPA